MQSPEKVKELQSFMAFAVDKFKVDEEEIKRLLRQRFGSFKRDQLAAYTEFLTSYFEEKEKFDKVKQDTERARQEWRDAILADEERFAAETAAERAASLGPAICPICGEPTAPNDVWRGRITKRPGWRCPAGIVHFIRWKANYIAEGYGRTIPFHEPFGRCKVEEASDGPGVSEGIGCSRCGEYSRTPRAVEPWGFFDRDAGQPATYIESADTDPGTGQALPIERVGCLLA